ncbi:chemotaxis protein [Zobellella denitrificans]|uniref:methyl-accepting chemotaxis protein n=1 Tax=Zobellella denitrificans TaxID=347534 RepID=UPI000B8C1327|nr:methyl-accepting chemotaxis protein [Zobellella denitrificans]OXS15398.1 chemotaxis protein [Zobellella denitrificans]
MTSIKTKLLAAFLCTTLLPVIVVVALTLRNVNQDAKQRFAEASSLDIAIVDQAFGNFFDTMGHVVSMMADYPILSQTREGAISTYFDEGRKPAEVAMANGGREQRLFELFSAIGNNNPTLGYVYMGDRHGGYLEWPGSDNYGNWDPRKRPWFDLGRDGNYQLVRRDGYYWEGDDSVYVSLLKGFRDERGDFEGVVAVDVSLKALTDMVQRIRFGETGFIMIVEGNGNVLVDGGNPANNFKPLAELGNFKVLGAQQAGLLDITIDGVDYMANVYQSPGLGWKFVGFMQRDEVYAEAQQLTRTTLIVSLVLVLLFGLLGLVIAGRIVNPINAVKGRLKTIAEGEGDLTTRLDVDSRDETGELARWFNQFVASTQRLVSAIKETSTSMDRVSARTNASASQMAGAIGHQRDSLEQIATAVTEMASTANEVARNCNDTADVSNRSLNATRDGKEIIDRSATGVGRLGDSIRQANAVILELEKETGSINDIISTIQDIAGQTNLLALNAAIEAARAGEQGRGFAVVADEVRTLANRTQQSTEEINNILGLLVSRTRNVSVTMEHSLKESDAAIALSDETRQAFEAIEASVEQIRDMTTQIASAAEEQQLVTEDINRNILAISESANRLQEMSTEVEGAYGEQTGLSRQLTQLVSSFRT